MQVIGKVGGGEGEGGGGGRGWEEKGMNEHVILVLHSNSDHPS